ncbi:trimethylguanosine synthase [Amniculicola lignicola CBS 123094]|uniref:Trimethylguanosine synthase n=1 Tax=Amniculicola lignicola CBS 123094 TaxID=1392246 RepID=A0A6A5WH22_9PLEO|nr:trimethylguanosine synthase [Amniculicola lignicola CBS 123094]
MADDAPEEEEIHQWDSPDQFPDNLKKYWFQRFQIWSLYDKGVWMTEDAWFGVTPEPIANKIATHISESMPKGTTTIIDAFSGVGGNAIAFARCGAFNEVFAIEKDPITMKCAKHNAKLYGVTNINFIVGDSLVEIKKRFLGRTNLIIFASPPWGGTEYGATDVFDLSLMEPYNLDKLYKTYSRVSKHLVLYLPRTSDLNQIAQYAPEGKKVEVAHYCIQGHSKALCAYFGDFDFGEDLVE